MLMNSICGDNLRVMNLEQLGELLHVLKLLLAADNLKEQKEKKKKKERKKEEEGEQETGREQAKKGEGKKITYTRDKPLRF